MKPSSTIVRVLVLLSTALALAIGNLSPVTAAPGAIPRLDNHTVEPPAPTATLSGLVNDSGGDLLDGIVVEAVHADNPDAEPVASAITYESSAGGHGGYTLNVPAGTYRVRFSSGDWERITYETLYYGGGAGTDVTVIDGQALELDPVALTRDVGVPVDGTVLGPDGRPLPGIEVSLYRYSPRDDYYYGIDWTTTDTQGRYTFDTVNRNRIHTVQASGRYTTDGDYLGYTSLYLGNALLQSAAETFTLPTGSPGTSLSAIDLGPGVRLTGSVEDQAGNPIPDVDVTLMAWDASTGTFQYVSGWGYTDQDGAYSIEGVAPGNTYTLFAYGEWLGYYDAYLGGGSAPESAERFEPPASPATYEVAPLVLTKVTEVARGTVTDLAGAPVEGVSVELWQWFEGGSGWSGYDLMETTTTGPDGSYELDRVRPGGTYTVRADGGDVGFGTRYLGNAGTEPEAVSFTLPDGGAGIDLDPITLERVATTVRGRILLSDGATPDGWFESDLYRWDEVAGYFDWVDSSSSSTGRYVFRDVQPGERYTVRSYYSPDSGPAVYDDGWLGDAGMPELPDAPGVFDVPAELTDVQPGDITLRRGRLLSGTVTAEDGGTLYGDVSISFHRWNPDLGDFDWEDSTYAREEGAYYVRNLPAGSYAVRATYYGYEGQQPYLDTWRGGTRPTSPASAGVVEVPAAGDLPGVDIVLDRGTQIRGTVTADDGAPLPGASVTAYQWVDQGGFWTLDYLSHGRSDQDGSYIVAARPDTDVWLEADRSGYRPYYLGGEAWPTAPAAANTLAVGGTDIADQDFTMTGNWGAVGTVAGERRSYCLANATWAGDWVDFGPESGLYLGGTGVISDQWIDDYRPELLEPTGRASVLAPFMNRRGGWAVGETRWGVSPDGNTLCVLWNGVRYTQGNRTNTYQALVEKNPAGGYDVTYNYDRVSWGASARVGHSNGSGTTMIVPGYEDSGYLDGAATGLVHNSSGSAQPGRYQFHFDGFAPTNPEPYAVNRPTLDGTATVGSTLTADPGRWRVDGMLRDDLEFVYTWLSRSTGPARIVGSGPTYTVQDSDAEARIWVRVQASEGEPLAGFATSVRREVGLPAASMVSPPTLSPTAPRVGDTLTADKGVWEVADGTLEDVTFSYQWLRNGYRIPGATTNAYTVRDQDELANLRVRVTASRTGYAAVRVLSAPVQIGESPTLQATVRPTLSGLPEVGETLTVEPGEWDTGGTGAPTFSYRWVVDFRTVNPDTGSDGTQYTLRAADIGKYVTVYVTASKPGFKSGYSWAVSPLVSGSGVEFGTLSGTVTKAGPDGARVPVAGADWTACEEDSWNCLWGVTGAAGQFSSTAVQATEDGVEYRITVYAPDGSNLMNAGTTAVVRSGLTSTVTLDMEAVEPAPANVTVPTQIGTYQGSPLVYWSEPQQVEVEGCLVEEGATYEVTFSDGTPSRNGSLTQLADLGGGLVRYGVTIPAFYPASGMVTVTTNVPANCDAGTEPTTFNLYIDPSGIVTDQYGRPIPGATVTLLRSDTPGGDFTVVPDGSDIMSEDNRTNPDVTDETGFFRWDVKQGYYKVQVDAAGCTQFLTTTMPVPPPAIDLLLKLDCDVAAPSATPTIGGSAQVGGTLTTDTGVWAAPLEAGVQWFRDGSAIEGATAEEYQVTAEDAGKELTVRHTARRPTYVQEEGRGVPVTFGAVEATSDPVTATKAPAPTATLLPSISGSVKVGSRITASPGGWSADGLGYGYQWLVDGAPVPGATAATFDLLPAHLGKMVSVRVTATRPGYESGTADSAALGVAVGDAAAATAVPTITGTPRVGSTLTAGTGTWNAAGLSFGYQWLRNGSPIAGATAGTYRPVAADAARSLSVKVTATRDGHADGTATSAPVKVAKMRSTTVAQLVKKIITTRQVAKVAVTVRVAGVAAPTGKVTVLRGRKAVKTVSLLKSAKGKVVVAFGRLPRGRHAISVRYSGTAQIAASTSRKVTLTVR